MAWLSQVCTQRDCYQRVDQITDGEFHLSVAMLYIQFIVYGALGWYLNQVIP
jgi:hypothetical protein